METRCRNCSSWSLMLKGYGQCSHPRLVKPEKSRGRPSYSDLKMKIPADGILVGESFGCIHWCPKEISVTGKAEALHPLTRDGLRELLDRDHMKPKDLADKLGIPVQRVSDWLSGKRPRPIPKLAVTALAAMGLL